MREAREVKLIYGVCEETYLLEEHGVVSLQVHIFRDGDLRLFVIRKDESELEISYRGNYRIWWN